MMPYAEAFVILSSAVTGEDEDGNDIWTPTEVATSGAFAPAGSTEINAGQATVITHDTLYLDEGEPVPGPHDKMRVREVVREVEGVPAVYRSPFTGWRPGAVVRLTTVTG